MKTARALAAVGTQIGEVLFCEGCRDAKACNRCGEIVRVARVKGVTFLWCSCRRGKTLVLRFRCPRCRDEAAT